MKKAQIIIALVANIVVTTTFGQTDTVFTTLSQESGTLGPQQFLGEYDRVFGALKPAKWMFKSDLGQTLSSLFTNPGFHVGFETKLGKAVSVGADYYYSPPSENGLTINLVETFSNTSVRVGTTVRWYYDMKKRIAAGRSASNFSGNYVALEAAAFRVENALRGRELVAKFGIQRRLLRYGYFDLSYGLGAKHHPTTVYNRGGWSLTSVPRVAVGVALFSPRKNSIPGGAMCDVLKCFQENRRMLKIDLFNLIRVGEISKQYSYFSFSPSVVLEQKIGNSPFSAGFGLNGSGGVYKISNANTQLGQLSKGNNASAGAVAELRWYFLQKQRILKGKSGNNLSGLFFGLHAEHVSGWSHYWYAEEKKSLNFNNTAVKGVIGLQHRILDHGFIAFKAGVGPKWVKNTGLLNNQTVEFKNYYPWEIYTELKVGLAF